MEKSSLIYNPNCSKCLASVKLLAEKQVAVELIEYLDQALSRQQLRDLIHRGVSPKDMIRTSEPAFQALNLDIESLTETDIIDLLLADSRLLQRPIFTYADRSIIARPVERLLEIL
ncbi:MAG: ArsC/Spx/MgsR family protein [Gammaproteobacteria bacterium]|jgi:arsenate reductase|nr:ArsC/Spx/MgsR family protein [Gammaproteobacteria bacterium]|tara:strand:+ start:53153 stop:53500 length:348 start_codon:yes stop_codon:yes gene_type:complete